nr:class F sortase [Chloroflexota bacterium]
DVVGLGVEPDGTLESPTTGGVIGWYVPSARPGQVGNMVASGHLDWDKQPAVFWRLKELRAGDRIAVVDEEGGRHEYEVEWVRQVDPANAPLHELLGRTTQRWLTLITCGGAFNPLTRDYAERTVVRARLVEG